MKKVSTFPKVDKVVSCEIFEASQNQPWDREQWKAVQGLCSDPGLGSAFHLPKPGALALENETLKSMVDGWISDGFRDNYLRLYTEGWLDEAFVNFIGSSPSQTKWAMINEQLIRSVHVFSTRPIVVVHFGMATPREWDPIKYPRLVAHISVAHRDHWTSAQQVNVKLRLV